MIKAEKSVTLFRTGNGQLIEPNGCGGVRPARVRERPIIFSGPMVRAILASKKTQTRRLATNRNAARIEPGDLLWVRETWAPGIDETQPRFLYKARGDWASRWRPSIHMPREASRITLRVTAVRVEPLRDITPQDAEAEGLDGSEYTARYDFAWLWDRINNKDGCRWQDNPLVRVIEFEVVK